MVKGAIVGIAVLLLGGVALVGWTKTRTYVQVGRENLTEQMDRAIGEFRVKQVEVRNAIRGLEQSVTKMKEGQITSQVRSEQLGKELAALEARKSQIQTQLSRLRDMISDNQAVILGGKEHSVSELEEMARKLVAGYRQIETQADGVKRSRDLLANNAATLGERISQAQATLSAMNSQREEIEAKMLALNTMREAAASAGGDASTLAESFKQAQNQLNGLYAKVETRLRIEEQEWQQGSGSAAADVDAILRATTTPAQTLSEIDAILGRK